MSIGQMQSIFARLDALERENDQLRKRLDNIEEAVTVPADLVNAADASAQLATYTDILDHPYGGEKRGRGRPKGALNGR